MTKWHHFAKVNQSLPFSSSYPLRLKLPSVVTNSSNMGRVAVHGEFASTKQAVTMIQRLRSKVKSSHHRTS